LLTHVSSSIGRDCGAIVCHPGSRRGLRGRSGPFETADTRVVPRLLRECHMGAKNVTRAGTDDGSAADGIVSRFSAQFRAVTKTH